MDAQRTQLIERIHEDEGLTGDLGGSAAQALRNWALQQAQTEAESQLDDITVTHRIMMIRSVARSAAIRAARGHVDVVAEAQRQYARVAAQPDTTMAIRTGPIRKPAAPLGFWQWLQFWKRR